MKKSYICEICNEAFSCESECSAHESVCLDTHRIGLELTVALNELLIAADSNGLMERPNVRMLYDLNRKKIFIQLKSGTERAE